MTLSYKDIEKKAISYCIKSEKCEYDIRQKMIEWRTDKETIDKIINNLIDNNFINHQRYVNAFVHDAIYIINWGRLKIRYLLQQKKISETLINEAIGNINIEDYEKNLEKLIRQRFQAQIPVTVADKLKIIKSLYSRGFEPDVTERIIERVLKNLSNFFLFFFITICKNTVLLQKFFKR